MEIVDKLYKSMKDGSLKWKIQKKLHEEIDNHVSYFYLYNKNTRFIALKDKYYKKLYKENEKFIENYILKERKYVDRKKRIWICWLQGYDAAPPLIKACINSIESNNPNFEIVLLTEENINKYITLPEHIERKYKEGKIGRAHYSDILRISLICKYGGIWIDSTVLCTDSQFLENISHFPLFVFKVLDLNRKDDESIVASNWLLSAFEESKILLLTRDLLYKYWENHDYAVDYYIFHLFFAMASRKYHEEWDKIPMYNNRTPHTLMFELENDFNENRWKQIIKMSDIHKLTRHIEFKNSKSNYEYIICKFGTLESDCDEKY